MLNMIKMFWFLTSVSLIGTIAHCFHLRYVIYLNIIMMVLILHLSTCMTDWHACLPLQICLDLRWIHTAFIVEVGTFGGKKPHIHYLLNFHINLVRGCYITWNKNRFKRISDLTRLLWGVREREPFGTCFHLAPDLSLLYNL